MNVLTGVLHLHLTRPGRGGGSWGAGHVILTQPSGGTPEGAQVPVTATHPMLDALDGVEVTGTGTWGSWNGKAQFQFSSLQTRDGDLGLIAHVLGNNLLPGIGPARAKKIVDKWGVDFVRHMNVPDLLGAKIGIGHDAAIEIATEWPEKEAHFSVLLGAIKLGLTAVQAMRAEKELGANFLALAGINPWVLCEVPGIGLATADAVARGMGKDFACSERTGTILHDIIVEHTSNGHTWMPITVAKNEVAKRAGLDISGHWETTLTLGKRVAVFDVPDGSRAVSTYSLHEDETYIARSIKERLKLKPNIALPAEGTMPNLSEEQREAVKMLLGHQVGILTGGPGTGKTHTLRALVAFLDVKLKEIVLCAPTGKAADRMRSATGREAQTIHSLLGEVKDGRVACDVLIVDEMSMVGTSLFARLLRHVSEKTQVFLVGDAFQLPPIDPGQVFRDLIRGGVPTARLTRIFRSDSTPINTAVRSVRERVPFQPDGRAFRLIDIPCEPEDAWLAEYVASLFDTGVLPEDTIVIAAFRATIDALNARLQKRNPNTPLRVGGIELALGDPVRHTKNNYDLGVFNGETGIVVSVDPTAMEDIYSGRPAVEVDYGEKVIAYPPINIDELKLAYAITIHASQGSEWDSVLVIYPYRESPRLKASWLALEMVYTAISRAKRLLVVAADPTTAIPFYLRPAKNGGAKDLNYRQTLLMELIQ